MDLIKSCLETVDDGLVIQFALIKENKVIKRNILRYFDWRHIIQKAKNEEKMGHRYL